MNRKIKFRAWDDVNKKFPFQSFHIIGEVTIFDLCQQYNLENLVKLKIQQFTGLHDKNGKEIYEGDILGSYPHGTVQVRWCEEFACFESYSIEKEFDESGDYFEKEITNLFANDLIDCKDTWIVIGNIFENPELLSA
jgi:uncharacterized phage protein (TIGR01671 family)